MQQLQRLSTQIHCSQNEQLCSLRKFQRICITYSKTFAIVPNSALKIWANIFICPYKILLRPKFCAEFKREFHTEGAYLLRKVKRSTISPVLVFGLRGAHWKCDTKTARKRMVSVREVCNTSCNWHGFWGSTLKHVLQLGLIENTHAVHRLDVESGTRVTWDSKHVEISVHVFTGWRMYSKSVTKRLTAMICHIFEKECQKPNLHRYQLIQVLKTHKWLSTETLAIILSKDATLGTLPAMSRVITTYL